MKFLISTRDFKEDWESTRQKGFLHFVLSNGTVFGLILFIIIELYRIITANLTPNENMGEFIWYSVFVYVFFSWLVYAPMMWVVNQWLYKKYSKE